MCKSPKIKTRLPKLSLRNPSSHQSLQQSGRLVVTLHEGVAVYDSLATRLVQAGFRLRLFKEEEISLEAAFMALTKGMRSPMAATGLDATTSMVQE